MRPSSRFDYVLRALVDLALHEAGGPVKLSAIAKRQMIPLRYLEQLFNRLRRQGFVIAERGPRGGYRLKRHPSEISISAVFQSFELSSDEKVPGTSKFRETVPGTKSPTRSIWRQVEKAVQTTLQATTLEALAAQAREQNPALNHRFTFHI